MKDFKRDLASLLNKHGFDSLTNTPDHELADFLAGILLIMPRGKRPPLVPPCHYCEERDPTGSFAGKPCCRLCSERMMKGQPTTTDPLPAPPTMPTWCDWDGCARPGPNRLQGKNFCNQHFHEATQP